MQKEIDFLMNKLPNNEEARKLRGYTLAKICFEKYGDTHTAKKYLKLYLEERPNNIPAIVLMGDILVEEKLYSEALECYEKAYNLNNVQKELLLKICGLLLKIPYDITRIKNWLTHAKKSYPFHEKVLNLEMALHAKSPGKDATDKFYDSISNFSPSSNKSPSDAASPPIYPLSTPPTSHTFTSHQRIGPNPPPPSPKLFSKPLSPSRENLRSYLSHEVAPSGQLSPRKQLTFPPTMLNSPLTSHFDLTKHLNSAVTSAPAGNIIINLGGNFTPGPSEHDLTCREGADSAKDGGSERVDGGAVPRSHKILEHKVKVNEDDILELSRYMESLNHNGTEMIEASKKSLSTTLHNNNLILKYFQELSQQQTEFAGMFRNVFDGLKSLGDSQRLMKEQFQNMAQSLSYTTFLVSQSSFPEAMSHLMMQQQQQQQHQTFGQRPTAQPSNPHHYYQEDPAEAYALRDNRYDYQTLHNQGAYPYDGSHTYDQGHGQRYFPASSLPSDPQNSHHYSPYGQEIGKVEISKPTTTPHSTITLATTTTTISMNNFQFKPFASTTPSNTAPVGSKATTYTFGKGTQVTAIKSPETSALEQKSLASVTATTVSHVKGNAPPPTFVTTPNKPIFSFKPSPSQSGAIPEGSKAPTNDVIKFGATFPQPVLPKQENISELSDDRYDSEEEDYSYEDEEDEEDNQESSTSYNFPTYSPIKSQQNDPTSVWTCNSCFVINSNNHTKCVACESPAPTTPRVGSGEVDKDLSRRISGAGSSFQIPTSFQFGFKMLTPEQKVKADEGGAFSFNVPAFGKFGDTCANKSFGNDGPEGYNIQDNSDVSVTEDQETDGNNSTYHSINRSIAKDHEKTFTGEENEVVLFEERAKLYRFDFDGKEWKERGLGQFKVLRGEGDGPKTRIILRRDHIFKLACNHYITPGSTKLVPFPNDTTGTKFSWHALDFVQPDAIEISTSSKSPANDPTQGHNEFFTVKFKTPEIASKFRAIFEGSDGSVTPKNKMGIAKETNSDEILVTYEKKPTPDQLTRAKALMMAPCFYTYENKVESKHKCDGCTYSDEEDTEEEGESEAVVTTNLDTGHTALPASQQRLIRIENDHLIDEGTGEDILFNERSKLYRYDQLTNEWKERGIGQAMILMKPTPEGPNSKCRILFRREIIFKVACNHLIDANVKLLPSTSNNTWAWRALDFAEEQAGVEEKFTIKFKNEEIAKTFKEVVDLCKAGTPPEPLKSSDIAKIEAPKVEKLSITENSTEASDGSAPKLFDQQKHAPTKASSVSDGSPATSLGSMFPTGSCATKNIDFTSLFQKTHTDSAKKPISSVLPNVAGSSVTPHVASDTSFGTTAKDKKEVVPTTSHKSSFNFGTPKLTVTKGSSQPATSVAIAPISFGSGFNKATSTISTAVPISTAISTITTTSLNSFKFSFSAPKPSLVVGSNNGLDQPTSHQQNPFSFSPSMNATNGRSHTASPFDTELGGKLFSGTDRSEVTFASLAGTDSSNLADDKAQSSFTKARQPGFFDPNSSRGINPDLLTPKPLFGNSPNISRRDGDEAPSPTPDDGDVDGERGDDYDIPATECGAEPVKPMVDLVHVTTGEENEVALFNERAKLFRFDNDTGEWKERGIGQFKVLRDRDEALKKYRLLLRREQIHKVACNHRLTPDLIFNPFPNDPKGTALSWQTVDFAENEDGTAPGKRELFTIKFKNQDILRSFKEIIEKCQRDISE